MAKTLQERLSLPYFNMGIDVFVQMSPYKFNIDNFAVQWEFASNMWHAVKLFSDMGFNLVVLCIFFKGNPLKKCVTLLTI